MRSQRPVNLNLFTIRFPLPAIVSILHRISGVILFLATPILLFFLQQSLNSEATFNQLKSVLAMPIPKGLWILFLVAVIYHLIAGIRHLIMDMGYGENIVTGKATALGVILATIIFAVILGVWL